LFTARGNWGFNDAYILGWKIFGLPIEEWMFFFCIPYACVFIYACVSKLLNVKDGWGWTAFAWAMVVVTGVTALLHVDKEYTVLKLGSASVFLAFYIIFTKGKNLGRLMFTYLLTEIPFLLVNGFLTFLPVVTYNDAENLGIRMSDVFGIGFLNIPVEDNVYSLLMLLLVVFGMEQIYPRLAKSNSTKSFQKINSDVEPIRTN
jgi:lycopene cyclase domain-containing protein